MIPYPLDEAPPRVHRARTRRQISWNIAALPIEGVVIHQVKVWECCDQARDTRARGPKVLLIARLDRVRFGPQQWLALDELPADVSVPGRFRRHKVAIDSRLV